MSKRKAPKSETNAEPVVVTEGRGAPKAPGWRPAGQRPRYAEQAEADGIRCRKCGCRDMQVTWVRDEIGGRKKRKRECRNCGEPRITIEK